MKQTLPGAAASAPPEIGGMLKIFVLLTIALLCANGLFVWYSIRMLRDLDGFLLDEGLGLIPLLSLDIAIISIFGILMYFGIRLIFRRWEHTPFYWMTVLSCIIVVKTFGVFETARIAVKFRQRIPLRATEALAKFDQTIEMGRMGVLAGIAACLLWMLYWQFSKRVAAYFAPSAVPARQVPIPELRFANRPTQECPVCGATNLKGGSYCRSCHGELHES